MTFFTNATFLPQITLCYDMLRGRAHTAAAVCPALLNKSGKPHYAPLVCLTAQECRDIQHFLLRLGKLEAFRWLCAHRSFQISGVSRLH